VQSTTGPAARARAGLFFGLLGPLAVWRDGEPLELGTPQEQRVLAALLLRRNEVVATDALVDALWASGPPANAVQVVRTYVSRLRHRLAPVGDDPPVEGRHGGYVLHVLGGAADVDRLEAEARAGWERLEAGDFSAAVSRLQGALALVRGPPLSGMEYESFCRGEVERLRELMLLAREQLVEARLNRGEHRTLVPELRAAVAEEPLREGLRRQLMLALYRSGRQVEALEAYREGRELLLERLGIEPSLELRSLERRILLQEQTLDHGAVGLLHGAPRFATSFVGRHGDGEDVRGRLGRERLVTLVGPAGTGKTRLAAAVAERLRRAFPDGVWWVDLVPAEADGVASAVERALGIHDVPGRSPEDLVVARLRGDAVLLVLDNCEHVLGPVAALVRRVLGETDARILVTSREPLQIDSEAVHVVPPLSTDSAAGGPAESDAARLFRDRAHLGAGEANTPAIDRIVRRLDGLPLAIELAAAKLRALSPGELAERLEGGIGLLGGQERGPQARHRTLEAAISWSIDLLDGPERAALLRLAIFPGTFDADAVEAVVAAGEIEPDSGLLLLTRLVDKSLVTVEVGEPSRYRLLWTVRAFARRRARAHGELEGAARRHRDHYLDLGEQVYRHMLDEQLADWLVRMRPDRDNFQAALRWSLERGDADEAAQLASALAFWWYRTGQLSEGTVLLRRALTLVAEDSPWRPRALAMLSLFAFATGAADVAEIAPLAVEAGERAGGEPLAFALVFRAQLQITEGRLDQAVAGIERARSILASLEHPEVHSCDQLLGVVYARRGDLARARAVLTRSVEGYRKIRKPLDAGWSLVELARVELAAGRLTEAERWASDAVRDFRVRGDPRGLAASFTVLGRAHAPRDDVERARVLLDEALALARRWSYPLEGHDAESALRDLTGSSRV